MVQRARWAWVLIAATLPMLALAFLRSERTSCLTSGDADGGRPMVCTTSHVSLVEDQGWGVLLVLLVPMALAALPLLLPWRPVGVTVAVVFSLGSFVAMASVGLFFLPAVGLAWWAASAPRDDAAPSRRVTSMVGDRPAT